MEKDVNRTILTSQLYVKQTFAGQNTQQWMALSLPSRKTSMWNDGAVAWGQQGKIEANRILVLTVTITWKQAIIAIAIHPVSFGHNWEFIYLSLFYFLSSFFVGPMFQAYTGRT